jgi:hypothetical protein
MSTVTNMTTAPNIEVISDKFNVAGISNSENYGQIVANIVDYSGKERYDERIVALTLQSPVVNIYTTCFNNHNCLHFGYRKS